MKHIALLLLAAFALAWLGGCDATNDADFSSADAQSTSLSHQDALATVDRDTHDGYLLSISERVPDFAGLFEENGMLRVAVARSAQDPAAVVSEALTVADELAPGGSAPLAERAAPTPASALYGFADVLAWREALALTTPGLSLHDADERKGLVYVEVTSSQEVGRVRESAAALGIPSDALEVRVEPRYEAQIDIRNYGPYLEAGYAIAMQWGHCTHGFMAFRGSMSGDIGGFVTNSHCTNASGAVGGVNSAQFYQGNGSYGNSGRYLGVEIVDPAFNTLGRPVGATAIQGPPVGGGGGRPWRYSDATFVDYDLSQNNTNTLFGQIAKTRYAGTNSPGSHDRIAAFQIESDAASYQHIVGTVVDRVGRTSGWTTGPITRSCVTIPLDNTNPSNSNAGKDLRCQYEVRAYSDAGDSGSPVFFPTGSNTARLQGLLWGGRTESNGTRFFVYSAFHLINRELRRSGSNGDLYTHNPSSPRFGGTTRIESLP
ncbi:MAG: hypothetical protein AAGI91_07080 [Bacteroidota bacterium]